MTSNPQKRGKDNQPDKITQLDNTQLLILKALGDATARADQQQEILADHERRIAFMEAQLRGQNEQN